MTTIRLVTDAAPGIDPAAVLPDKCLKRVDPDHLCFLPRHHKGQHLPLPKRWAQQDVGPHNPRYVPAPRKAVEL